MQKPAQHKIDEAAARWFLRMREPDIAAHEQTTFEKWLLSSPTHQRAYAEFANTWEQTQSQDNLQKLVNAVKQKTTLDQSKRGNKLNKHLANLAMGCFIGVLALLGFNQYQVWQAAPVMQMAANNPVGQITTQTLEDGSRITLSANSDMQVTYYRNQRHVSLLRGEAIFEVTKDQTRPFIVETENAKVTVLGTRFAVNKLSNLVRVSVDHGRVQVESHQPQGRLVLSNGQVAEIATLQSPQIVARSAANAFSFAQGKLVFDRANLAELAETLSRYRAMPIQVQGQGKAEITAVIQIKDAEQFIQGLPNIAKVNIEQNAQRTFIKQR